KDECLRIVREETDVFVGIYAHRYGSIPLGDDASITQQEYEEAYRREVPIFGYLVKPGYEGLREFADQGPKAERLSAFIERLKRGLILADFPTADSLAKGVAADIGRHFAMDPASRPMPRRGLIHSPPSSWVSSAGQNQRQYKVVLFDLDGTLLRGRDFK